LPRKRLLSCCLKHAAIDMLIFDIWAGRIAKNIDYMAAFAMIPLVRTVAHARAVYIRSCAYTHTYKHTHTHTHVAHCAIHWLRKVLSVVAKIVSINVVDRFLVGNVNLNGSEEVSRAKTRQDWIVWLSGLADDRAVWCRLNKLLLYWSNVNPGPIIYSGTSLNDLLVQFVIVCHTSACMFYYLGRVVPSASLGHMNQQSIWRNAETSLGIDTFHRGSYHAALHPEAPFFERYVLCWYWVISTITCAGVVDALTPQNYVELILSIGLLLFNL
jgi:hypothetical protein